MLDITGQTFGRLLVVRLLSTENGVRVWECLCSCGSTTVVSTGALRCGNTTSCGCSRRKPRKNFLQGQSGLNILFSDYKKSAKNRNLIFALSKDEFKYLTSSNCYYCNREPSQTITSTTKASNENKSLGRYVYNGIDRKKNDEGYVSYNCVPCCKACNFLKRGKNHTEFLNMILAIAIHRVGLR